MHPEYMSSVVPESLRQRTAATFFQDLWLFERPWSFNLADIPAAAQQSIHIWHGTGDKQVSCWPSQNSVSACRTTGWMQCFCISGACV